MLKFTFLRKTKQWAVIGPVDEVKLGVVHVQTAKGDSKTEHVIKVTAPFDTAAGPCRYGIISVLPRGRK